MARRDAEPSSSRRMLASHRRGDLRTAGQPGRDPSKNLGNRGPHGLREIDRPRSPLHPLASEPLYHQVFRLIADEIAAGRFQVGQRLPSERALTERFGISRVTARRALLALYEEGLVDSAAGKGWFVAATRVGEPPNKLMSFSAMGRSSGFTVTSKVIEAGVRPAGLDEAETLGVVPTSRVFELLRLRMLDGLPVVLDRIIVLSAPILAETNFETASLYETLRTIGIIPTSCDFVVEARRATEEESEALDLEFGAPLLVAAEKTFDQNGRPIGIGQMRYRADRYRFRARLTT